MCCSILIVILQLTLSFFNFTFVLLLVRVEQQPSCSGSRFSNGGYGTFSNGTSFNFGFPEICADGMSYSPICGELTEQEAVLFCSDASGQYGECYHYNY